MHGRWIIDVWEEIISRVRKNGTAAAFAWLLQQAAYCTVYANAFLVLQSEEKLVPQT